MAKNNRLIIILVAAMMFACALLIIAFSAKLHLAKKALHIDSKRYEQVNMVCFEEKNPIVCQNYLKEDLDILLKQHRRNHELINSKFSLSQPLKIVKVMYKEQENVSVIEPEILLKTLLLKKILFKELSDHVKAGLLGEEIETYVSAYFSNEHKKEFLRMIESQDADFVKYSKKLKSNKKSKHSAEVKKSAEHFVY